METLLNPPLSARVRTASAPAFDLEEFLAQGALLGAGADSVWLGWGKPRWSAQPAPGKTSIYAPDFFLEASRPWLTYANQREVPRDELLERLSHALSERSVAFASAGSPVASEAPGGGRANSLEWSPPDAVAFHAAFADLQRQFAAGTLRKAVPVVFERARDRVDAGRKGRWLASLLKNSRGLPVHPYGFWTRDEGMLGASPETLFELEAPAGRAPRVLRTMALAGTRPAMDAERLPILADPKELREHRIVVEGITQAIREAGWGEMRVGELRELKLPTLSHLQTRLEVDLARPVGFEELAQVLHPTPALGAFPREEGMKWLARQRELPGGVARRRFGAPFGVTGLAGAGGAGTSRCWVAIRNLQWARPDQAALSRESSQRPELSAELGTQEIYLGAGCGIVAESQVDREWNELALKIRSVKRFFDL